MALPFRLDGLGGYDFDDGPKQANLARLPWGGATSNTAAYARGPLLVNNVYNEERLVLFHERVLAPTVISITEAMITAEKAHFATRAARWLRMRSRQPTSDIRQASLGKVGRVRAAIGTLAGGAACAANSGFLVWPSLPPLLRRQRRPGCHGEVHGAP